MERMIGELEYLDGVLEGELVSDLPAIEGVLKPDETFSSLSGELKILPYAPGATLVRYATTEEWDADPTLIAEQGVIYVYSDYKSIVVDGDPVYIPGLKVGDGSSYLMDLPFIDDDLANKILNHINDTTVHITSEERILWNKRTYVHEQARVSDVWEVTHDLDKHPSVTVVDSAGTVVVGDVQYIDNSNIIITFNGAFSGTAYLN